MKSDESRGDNANENKNSNLHGLRVCGIELRDLCLKAIFKYFKNDGLKFLTADYANETFIHAYAKKLNNISITSNCNKYYYLMISSFISQVLEVLMYNYTIRIIDT